MAAARGGHRVCKATPLCRGLLAGKEIGRAFSSGGSNTRDEDFPSSSSRGAGSIPPASSKDNISSFSSGSSAAAGKPASDLWKSLVGQHTEKKQNVAPSWDFLQDLNERYSSPRPQTFFSSRPSSYRKMGDSGIEFLSEELERPVTVRQEPAVQQQQEFGEDSLLNSASYNLIRESFQPQSGAQPPSREPVGILNDFLGVDTETLFSSQETWSKKVVDSRTLAEVEGNFYSTMDQAPAEDIKSYTYEELGEKLRQARPPTEHMLSSATGLSFGELRTRFQWIEEMENKVHDGPDVRQDYEELKNSLNQMRPFDSFKARAAQKQLSYEELAFMSNVGTRPSSRMKIEYMPPKDDLLTKYYSDAQLSSKERLKLEIKQLKAEFQTHECDSGSPQVQIAILTARINNLNRHMREGPNYKRDKHSRKGLNDMVQYRKRMLRYLRRRDWPVYCNVLTKLKLDDVILEKRR